MRENCILECDSPSYPPTIEEYVQCGCMLCIKELGRQGYYVNDDGKLIEPRTAAGSLD